MNSMIENLVIDMRALGIRSLALELSDDPSPLSPSRTDERERETLAPGDLPICPSRFENGPDGASASCSLPAGHEGRHRSGGAGIADSWSWPDSMSAPAVTEPVEPEFRGDPNQCAMEGCGEPNGGVLGGKQKALCRKHAFAKLGIK